MRCLVTGASGFIGRALIPSLQRAGHTVSIWTRDNPLFDFALTDCTKPPPSAWMEQLRSIDVVVHLAALAHQQNSDAQRERYFRVNRDGAVQLAAAARNTGVKRFIFLSSAKIFGEGGATNYCETSPAQPHDAYARSKWEAEQLLTQQCAGSTMELVILRPPLVYGIDAGANFARLLKLARSPLPLPFANVTNQRALIGIDNLIDLIVHCIVSTRAIGGTWLCADTQLYSLPDIIRAIRSSLDRSPRLWPMPAFFLTMLQRLLGEEKSARLFGDFIIDARDSQNRLQWTPPFAMEQILRAESAA